MSFFANKRTAVEWQAYALMEAITVEVFGIENMFIMVAAK